MYKVTVRDIVEARAPELRSRNEFDVLGNYKIPDTQALLYKPHTFAISKNNDRDYLEKSLKSKKNSPGPGFYNIAINQMGKRSISIYKTDKKSYVDEIQKKAKLTPAVGVYQTIKPERIKGVFKR